LGYWLKFWGSKRKEKKSGIQHLKQHRSSFLYHGKINPEGKSWRQCCHPWVFCLFVVFYGAKGWAYSISHARQLLCLWVISPVLCHDFNLIYLSISFSSTKNEPRPLQKLYKHSTTEVHPKSLSFFPDSLPI
jgi:hypothetical protein